MTTPRTARIRTLDHGTITVTCPPWCLGVHEDGGYRADILHRGPDTNLTFHGHDIADATLVQSPYATPGDPELGGPTPGVSVSLIGRTLDPVTVYGLAAALDGYADRLRDLADQLAVILAGGEGQ